MKRTNFLTLFEQYHFVMKVTFFSFPVFYDEDKRNDFKKGETKNE